MKKMFLSILFTISVGSVVAADNGKVICDARNEMLGQMGIGWQARHMPPTARCIADNLSDRRVVQISIAFVELVHCTQSWRGKMFGYRGCGKETRRYVDMLEDTKSAIIDCMNKNN